MYGHLIHDLIKEDIIKLQIYNVCLLGVVLMCMWYRT